MTLNILVLLARRSDLAKYAALDRESRAVLARDHECTPACTDTPGPIRLGRRDEPTTPGRPS